MCFDTKLSHQRNDGTALFLFIPTGIKKREMREKGNAGKGGSLENTLLYFSSFVILQNTGTFPIKKGEETSPEFFTFELPRFHAY
jgi:hypothetical protein